MGQHGLLQKRGMGSSNNSTLLNYRERPVRESCEACFTQRRGLFVSDPACVLREAAIGNSRSLVFQFPE